MDPKIHTRMSVTLIREWYDEQNPAVEFHIDHNRLRRVTVNGSSGTRYKLRDRDLGGKRDPAPFPRADEGHRETK